MNTKNNLWESTCNEPSKYKALSENKTTDIINDMGQKILESTTREINKLLP